MKKRIGIVLLIVLLVVSWGFQRFFSSIATDGFLDSEKQIPYSGGIFRSREEGEDRSVGVSCYDYPRSLEKLNDCVAASRAVGDRLVAQGVDTFYVGVTLRNYMDVTEFDRVFVGQFSFQPKAVRLRGTFPNLEPDFRVGLGGEMGGNRITDAATWKSIVSNIDGQAREKAAVRARQARRQFLKLHPQLFALLRDWPRIDWYDMIQLQDGDYRIKGVTAFTGRTDAKGYLKLRDDPHVFNVDVTPTLVYKEIEWRCLCWQEFADTMHYQGYDYSWSLEEVGVMNYRE